MYEQIKDKFLVLTITQDEYGSTFYIYYSFEDKQPLGELALDHEVLVLFSDRKLFHFGHSYITFRLSFI